MAAPPIIELRGVAVRFGGQEVLAGIDLAVYPQESVAIVGESGCGKTVLLRLVVGLLQPTAGEVLFEGTPIHDLRERELARMRRRMGFLFQHAALFDSVNVFENVAFGPRAVGELAEPEITDRVRERLVEVGLPEGIESKMPAELSGGMRKRVGLARALALDPNVMLYDEPTTGLDPVMTDAINDLILQTRTRRPVTSVIVTHELRTVAKCADRVVMLYPRGRLQSGGPQVIFDGSPETLRRSEDPRVREFVEGTVTPGLPAVALAASK